MKTMRSNWKLLNMFSTTNFKSQGKVIHIIFTQPGKVKCNLLSKVLSDVVQWLVLVPFAPAAPVVMKNLPLVQLVGTNLILWKLEGALWEKKHAYCRGQAAEVFHPIKEQINHVLPRAGGKPLCTRLHSQVCPLRPQPSSFCRTPFWQESHTPTNNTYILLSWENNFTDLVHWRGTPGTHDTVSLRVREVGVMVVTAKKPEEERQSFSQNKLWHTDPVINHGWLEVTCSSLTCERHMCNSPAACLALTPSSR